VTTAALALLLSAQARADRQCLDDAPVCLDILEQDGVTRFVASNATARPWSFRVAVDRLKNLKASRALPIRAVIGPGEQRTIATLAPVRPDLTTSWSSSWGAAPGSMLARPDASWRYRMPFGGSRERVLSQGAGGRFSHSGPARYSFDFSMPSGTPVLAARAGRVVSVRDGFQDSGRRKVRYDEANSVEVLQADGSVAVYAHLRKGIPVQVGDSVVAGERIGFSGDSGYSTGPHLHFMVWRRQADLSWESVPIRFADGSAAGFVPATGVAYAPACSGGDGCLGAPVPAPESVPARIDVGAGGARRDDGACQCANGAVIHVDLPCSRVCGH
jgi:murein DD-endopeptidase MepM/ murein hydrolase activator NlpD